jgi:hypothetical protein
MEDAIMPRITEWFAEKPVQSDFSTIINNSVFKKLVEFIVESEKGFLPNASFIYSRDGKNASIEIDHSSKRVELSGPIFKGSDYNFSASEFHRLCDHQGPTLVVMLAENGEIVAGLASLSWDGRLKYIRNPRGFLATITPSYNKTNPSDEETYSIAKYDVRAFYNERRYDTRADPDPLIGPSFFQDERIDPNYWSESEVLVIGDSCNQAKSSWTYTSNPDEREMNLFGIGNSWGTFKVFKVAEYEVYKVKLEGFGISYSNIALDYLFELYSKLNGI